MLCLLEVGRLAQMWWGLEPPGIVKLERELDGEEWSGRYGVFCLFKCKKTFEVSKLLVGLNSIKNK